MTSPAELQAIREPVKRFALIDLVMATHIGGESYVRAADFDAQSDEVRRLRSVLTDAALSIEAFGWKDLAAMIRSALGSQP